MRPEDAGLVVHIPRSLQDERVVVMPDGPALVLWCGTDRIAEAPMPGAGPKLTRYAMARGATKVEHPYDLRTDEPF